MKNPIVESAEVQVFNGVRFRLNNSYFRANGKLLHREVWKAVHGPIPSSVQVHHRDHDPRNNRLSNLVAVDGRKHLSEHMTPERRRASTERLLRYAIPAAAKWHGSEEGLAWHREHGRATWEGRKSTPVKCSVCDVRFETWFPARSKFCGGTCRARARRARRGQRRRAWRV